MTIVDVARLAGVSKSTAARAVGKSGYVSKDAQERVERAAGILGYSPNPVAQDLRRQRSPYVGVLVPNLAIPFYAGIAAGASAGAREAGKVPIVIESARSAKGEQAAAESLIRMHVGGVIAVAENSATIRCFGDNGVRSVEVDRRHSRASSDASVLLENQTTACRLTEHLLDLGHRRIAFIANDPQHFSGRTRLLGYRDALSRRDVPFDPGLVLATRRSAERAESVITELLTSGEPPRAVFAVNELPAEATWRVAASLGMSVPGDLAIAALDPAPWMRLVQPELTRSAVDPVHMGSAAYELLQRMLSSDLARSERHIEVPAAIEIHGSTDSHLA